MSNRTVAAVALLAALSAVTLSGCTAPEPEAVETAAAVQPAAEPSAEPVASPTPDSGGCVERSEVRTGSFDDDNDLTTTMNWVGPDLADRGPMDMANGTVTYGDDGRIASYTVAAGDARDAISDRFCVYLGSIFWALHRDDLAGGAYQPGDVLPLYVDTSVPFTREPVQ